eukprot:Em0012g848a
MDHFNAHHAHVESTEAVFDYYRRIDTGEGIDDDWPIQLKHPSKCNVKVTDDLYDEIQIFCTATFDDVVYVSHRIDKFGRCYVNGTIYSSDYNSTDRASVVKSMFVLSGTDEIHPYFGIIRFFFRIIIKCKDSAKQDLPPHMCLKTWAYVTLDDFQNT